jgi:hypothetical protein
MPGTVAEIRRPDAGTRKRTLVLVAVGAAVGALLILAFAPFGEWLASQPGEMAHRVKLVFFLAGIILSVPLFVFAAYFWVLAANVLRNRKFPPPGYPIAHDLPVLRDEAAVRRGHALQALSLCLVLASVMLLMLLWELGSAFHEGIF